MLSHPLVEEDWTGICLSIFQCADTSINEWRQEDLKARKYLICLVKNCLNFNIYFIKFFEIFTFKGSKRPFSENV